MFMCLLFFSSMCFLTDAAVRDSLCFLGLFQLCFDRLSDETTTKAGTEREGGRHAATGLTQTRAGHFQP